MGHRHEGAARDLWLMVLENLGIMEKIAGQGNIKRENFANLGIFPVDMRLQNW
jgi:hypothetical protein